MKVGIIGLGLIGGSLGLNLRDMKLISKVVGFEASKQNAADAVRLGLVDEIVSFEEVKRCDIIFLAIPVEAVIKVLDGLKMFRRRRQLWILVRQKRRFYAGVLSKFARILSPPILWQGRKTRVQRRLLRRF